MTKERQTTVGDIRKLIDGLDDDMPIAVCDDSSFAWEFKDPEPIKLAMVVRTANEQDRFVLVKG